MAGSSHDLKKLGSNAFCDSFPKCSHFLTFPNLAVTLYRRLPICTRSHCWSGLVFVRRKSVVGHHLPKYQPCRSTIEVVTLVAIVTSYLSNEMITSILGVRFFTVLVCCAHVCCVLRFFVLCVRGRGTRNSKKQHEGTCFRRALSSVDLTDFSTFWARFFKKARFQMK